MGISSPYDGLPPLAVCTAVMGDGLDGDNGRLSSPGKAPDAGFLAGRQKARTMRSSAGIRQIASSLAIGLGQLPA